MFFKRKILSEITKFLNRDEFIIITGARQTGKTSILMMIKSSLTNNGKQCHYVNLENHEYLNLLNKHPFNIFELIPDTKAIQYVFIDEIQYLNDPTNFLKLLFDEKRSKIKIIASGSSAFYIDEKFKDSLAGRKLLFEIYPLNFEEVLIFNKQEELLNKNSNKLKIFEKKIIENLWEKYLTYGGYPKVVLAENDEMRKIVLEEIGSSYIKRDIVDAGIKKTDKYFSLIKILASQIGKLVNSQELSNTLKITHKTIEDYLYVMKKSYQVAFIHPFCRNTRKELTKMPKVYFHDMGLRNVFINDFSKPNGRLDKGEYLENIVFTEFVKRNNNHEEIKFWRTQDKKEVDFIVEGNAFEVKFSSDDIKEKKYQYFKELYPEIKLTFLTNKNILELFYKLSTIDNNSNFK